MQRKLAGPQNSRQPREFSIQPILVGSVPKPILPWRAVSPQQSTPKSVADHIDLVGTLVCPILPANFPLVKVARTSFSSAETGFPVVGKAVDTVAGPY